MKDAKREAQIALAWSRGVLGWKLDENQQGMREHLLGAWDTAIKHVWNCSRQLGKSYLACVIAAEYALQHPRSQIKYAAPTAKMVRKILRPHFREIFIDCPEHLRPRFHSADGEYRFPNGSVITVAGCDRDNVETLRGQHAHLVIVDEAGAMSDLQYVVDDVLLPQTTNTSGRILVVSTPAKIAGHPFKFMCDDAKKDGTYVERTIFHNPRLSDHTISELCKAAGGEQSTTWRREYLVQHVTDEQSAVIPEANADRLEHITLKIDPARPLSYRPEHYSTLIWMDPGWNPDPTGILWVLWDFKGARFIVEDEHVMRKMDTATLAACLRSKTDALWGVKHKPYQCVSDVDGRLIAELASRGWIFLPTEKDNLDEAINSLRHSVNGIKYPMYIHPRCVQFKSHLENATWNKQRTRFERTAKHGHFDLLSAAIYGRRNLPVFHDPTPAEVVPRGFFKANTGPAPLSQVAQRWKRALGLR